MRYEKSAIYGLPLDVDLSTLFTAINGNISKSNDLISSVTSLNARVTDLINGLENMQGHVNENGHLIINFNTEARASNGND